MKRAGSRERWGLGGAAVVALVLGALPAVAAAQTQDDLVGRRYQVLVPAFEALGGAEARIGASVADELRKRIRELATHTAADARELRAALRRYNLSERELDCVRARQLAVQMGSELVMCGTYAPVADGLEVRVSVIGAKSGETFEIEPFVATTAGGMAERVFTKFSDFVEQTRLAAFGVQYLSGEQWEPALDNCGRAWQINPQAVSAGYCVARALLGLDSLAASLAAHLRVLELNPVHTDALLTGGIVAARLDDQTTARALFKQYLDLDASNVEVRLRVATDLARAGDPAGALRIAEEGLETQPENLALQEFAGHFAMAAAQKAGADAAAAPFYDTALGYYRGVFAARGAETDPTLLRNMIATLNQLDRHQEAAELGAQVLAVRPEHAPLWAIYADALQRVGRLDAAIAALDSVAARDAEYANLHGRRAMWLLQAGQVARARTAFRTAIERGELTGDAAANAIFNFGYAERFQKGQEEAAVEFLEESRQFATTAGMRARSSFFIGVANFNRARRLQEPGTTDAARAALPVFQKALEQFEQSRAYREQERAVAQFIEQSKTFIEIQEAIIKRGR
jgi:tetratricopeptide (TPR) repeat protein